MQTRAAGLLAAQWKGSQDFQTRCCGPKFVLSLQSLSQQRHGSSYTAPPTLLGWARWGRQVQASALPQTARKGSAVSHPTFDCPHCNAEVPAGALRCKDCFNELGATEARSLTGPMVGLLLFTLLVGAAGMWAWNVRYHRGQLGSAVVDHSEQRVVLVYTSTFRQPKARQVGFEEVQQVLLEGRQFIMAGDIWKVSLVLGSGEKLLLRTGTESLEIYGQGIAQQLKKELRFINKLGSGRDLLN